MATPNVKSLEQRSSSKNELRPKNELQSTESSYNTFDYTPANMQAKLDERTFRSASSMQSSISRARLLNSMYSELITESVKGDPYLRKAKSTGCEPLRGKLRHSQDLDDC